MRVENHNTFVEQIFDLEQIALLYVVLNGPKDNQSKAFQVVKPRKQKLI